MIQIGQSRRSDAGKSLAAINAQLNQQQLRSITARDAFERTVIRAPQDGVVESLALAAPGDVVKPAESLMTIVPDKDHLLVEGRLPPGGIDRVHDGQEVIVRLTGMEGGRTPELHRRILHVGMERMESGQSFFPARIALDPAPGDVGQNALKAGMPAELFIKTGERSLLSYIVPAAAGAVPPGVSGPLGPEGEPPSADAVPQR